MPIRKFELKRKAFHLFFGIITVVLLAYDIINISHVISILGISLIFSLISRNHRIPIIHILLEKLERKDHIKKFPAKGLIFYLAGAAIVLWLFPKDIALASILVLAFADSIGQLVGMYIGKTPHPFTRKKFVEGWIFGFISGFFGALIFVPWHEALAASFFAMLVEGIELKIGLDKVDDNLLIPIAAASAIFLIRIFF
jgi:dolichol kinase